MLRNRKGIMGRVGVRYKFPFCWSSDFQRAFPRILGFVTRTPKFSWLRSWVHLVC